MPIPLLIYTLPKVKISSGNLASGVTKAILRKKAISTFGHIQDNILGNKILDIGMGAGGISYYLKEQGFDVTGINVNNFSLYEALKPIIYDGHTIPFEDKTFDTAILVHVLHHCENRFEVLNEALRVSKRVIVIEDTYRTKFEHLIVSLNDCLGNFEFFQHKYLTVAEWQNYLKKEVIKVVGSKEWSEFTYGLLYGRYIMYVLERC